MTPTSATAPSLQPTAVADTSQQGTTFADEDSKQLLEAQDTTSMEVLASSSSADNSMPLYDPLLETQFDPVIQQSCKIFNYCLGK